jgi:hypothetical protein
MELTGAGLVRRPGGRKAIKFLRGVGECIDREHPKKYILSEKILW